MAVTGIGLVTAFGFSAGETWRAVLRGRSALRALDLEGFRCLGAPVENLPPGGSSEPNISLALAVADEAVHDARLDRRDLATDRAACTLSSSKGGMKSLFRIHRDFLAGAKVPCDFHRLISPASCASAVARQFGISGPVVNYAAACATGVHSVIGAANLILDGRADVVIAGAADASLVRPLVAAFDRMGVLSRRFDDPAGCCKPYDRRRDGFAIGEGAAALVLESEARVASSPERVYAWVRGTCWGADAYDIVRVDTARSSVGRMISIALERAGLVPADVDYLNTHGTGTRANDPMEAAAIRQALGGEADRVPVSSLKPAIGHLLGAAGGAELALTVLAMRDGVIPPTLNLREPDAACALNHVSGAAREAKLRVAVKLAAGFGGQVGVVVLERGERRG